MQAPDADLEHMDLSDLRAMLHEIMMVGPEADKEWIRKIADEIGRREKIEAEAKRQGSIG
jgi:hypothetical protein